MTSSTMMKNLDIAELNAPAAAEYSQNINGSGFSTHANAHNHFVPAPIGSSPTTVVPQPPSFLASPSKNPCMVRVVGAQGAVNSRYRNDPYGCSVLPPLSTPAPSTSSSSVLAIRRLAPLGGTSSKPSAPKGFGSHVTASPPPAPAAQPPAFHHQTPSRLSHIKAGIARAQEFAMENRSSPSDSVVSSSRLSQLSLLEEYTNNSQSQNRYQTHHHQQQYAHFHASPQPHQLQTQHNLSQDLTSEEESPVLSREDMPLYTEEGYPQWAMVRLKHEVLLYNAGLPVKEGDFVVLEGDRGENIGRVHSIVESVPLHPVQCRILRLADDADIEAVRVQREKEEAAKHFAQGVSDGIQLGIKVVDTEFQTDGNKLTIYFTSRRQIDFRRLQRQMFKQYRCRIWLVNWADVVKVQQ